MLSQSQRVEGTQSPECISGRRIVALTLLLPEVLSHPGQEVCR